MKRLLTFSATLALSTLMVAQAQAHGIWFAERATQTAMIYGVGADDLDMVKRLPKIVDFTPYDTNLQPVGGELIAAGPLVLAVSEDLPPVYTAVMNNGIWSKTADGVWHNKGKDEVPDAIIAEKTMKYAVYVDGELGSLNTPLKQLPKHTLQIIPVGDNMPTMMGDKLTVKVLFEGKPAKGARILRDFVNDPDAEPIVTGADGKATFEVRNQGLNVIGATFDGPPDEPKKINKIEHFATLSFVLAHLPE